MAKLLEMPKLSPTMEEGQLSRWHKKVGDRIGVDDLLAEVETDKATMEFRSFDQGTLLKLLVAEGALVKLGQPVAILGTPGENIDGLLSGAPSSGGTSGPGASAAPTVGGPALQKDPQKDPQKEEPKGAPSAEPGRVRASPLVRKLARERGLDLTRMSGSGPHGRIVARDLEGAPAGAVASPLRHVPSAAPVAIAQAEDERRPLSLMRKTIARRLTESKQTVPHFYLTIDVDADRLAAHREELLADLSATLGDAAPKISVNDILVKAVAIALERVPTANARFTPEAIIYHKRVDISVAVSVEDGLVTPVVRDANRKSVLEISKEIRSLAARARDKKLTAAEMSEGTFSISNLGMFGIDAFAAVITPPEGAILAVGQIRKEPVVRDDAVVVGRKLALTLSCDHRVIDGAVGASFLQVLRKLLENPSQIFVF